MQNETLWWTKFQRDGLNLSRSETRIYKSNVKIT